MILPLHHCAALGCLELLNPDAFMCRRHEKMISDPTIRLLLVATTGSGRRHAELQACIEVAEREGLTPALSAFEIDLQARRLIACTPFPDDPDYAGTDADHLPITLPPDASQEESNPEPTPGAVESRSIQLPSAGP